MSALDQAFIKAYAKDPAYQSYAKRYRGHGHYEIRELQRLFPGTNWPPSMRYHHY